MAKSRRQFTVEEKHSILQEAERQGVSETARKYNLAHSVLNYWRKKYLSNGKEGLKANYKKADPERRALEEENARGFEGISNIKRQYTAQMRQKKFEDFLLGCLCR